MSTSHQNMFWYMWRENAPQLEQSIVKFAIAKRFQGDPRDVVQDVMLLAYRKWEDYDESRAAFSTWVLWLARQYLGNLYAKRRLFTISLHTKYDNDNGEEFLLEDIVASNSPTPEDVLLVEERRVQIWTTVHLACRSSIRKHRILEALAALLYDGEKPTTRNIAALVGCSHGTVASELREMRRWLILQKAGNQV